MAEEEKQEEQTGGEAQEEQKDEPKAEAPAEELKEEKPQEETVKEEPKVEEKPVEVREEKKPEPTGKFKELITQIESLSALELAELVKELEERFGVSAAAPVAVAAGAAPAGAPAAEEKANYTVILASSGDQKINVIKALREINPELGLKEAKDLADNAPKEVKKDAPKEEAEEAKKKLEAAGATVELK